ncbi:MAG: S8 family serine peptidase [Acidimicrobiia bacterium]|nr:S8 family serine peptidase [Acidimicrobiia bacterium]
MKLRRRAITLMAVVAMVGSVFATGAVAATPNTDRGDAPIRLRVDTFSPQRGEVANIPAHLRSNGVAEGQRGYYIVQFDGPIAQDARDAVAAQGAEILSYIPDFAYKVRMNPAQARKVSALDATSWVGVFEPGFKIDPDVSREGVNTYRVDLENGANGAAAQGLIAATGASIVQRNGRVLTIAATSEQIDAVAGVVDVAWISDFLFFEKHNEYGAGVIMGANVANSSGYDGSTQTVAVADTGIGDGTTSPHVDVNGRVTAVFDWPASSAPTCYTAFPDGAQDVDSGHGTHTALSVLSDGGPGGEGKGTAPAASLVFQATEDYADLFGVCAGSPDGYYLLGLPDDLNDLYQQAYNAGARVHSNSWGSSVAGDYTTSSEQTDEFTWNNTDMLITFSAGNSGTDANNNGVVDDDSIGAPATAKNVLTVGASENERADNFPCDSTSGAACSGVNDIFTYGSAWPGDFSAPPISTDQSAGNAEQMAAFSSRGPTDDGRIKPDVVAPGTWVLSGFSDLYQEFYDGSANPQNGAWQYDGWGFPLNEEYKYMGGTSMSNPLAAGAAAVVRDYYNKAHSVDASAALTKATLINSAVDMLDENNDGADDNDFPIPNSHEGWGRIDLANAVDGSAEFVDAAGLTTGGSDTYNYTATAGGVFKVTLAYSDFPSTATASSNLVNDLDLVVTAPDGTTTYVGNNFSSGWSQTGGSEDRTNNVENVYIQAASSGTYTVEVVGFNVPFGPQPYALVVDGGATGPVDNPPTVSVDAPANGATVSGTITVDTTASDDNGVSSVEVFVDGASIGFDTGTGVSFDTTTVNDGTVSISATATDTIGQTATDSVTVTVDNVVVDDPPTVSIDSPTRGRIDGTITIITSSSDDIGVASVEVFVEGASVGFDTGSGVVWNSATVPNGRTEISAVATDTSGQTASDQVNVNVQNTTTDTPPTVTVDAPTDGATVAGTITIDTTASDDNGVSSVEVFVDGASIGFDTGTGVSFDTTTVNDGTVSISATATDTIGQTATDAVSVTVDNVPNDDPPTVTVDAPTDGATVAGTITIDTTASDDNGVSSVEVFVDGASIGFDTGTGVAFDTTTVADGGLTISATATDTVGQTATDTIAVIVDNVVGGTDMHIGDLDGTSAEVGSTRYTATVTARVHDDSEAAVAGVTVNFSYVVRDRTQTMSCVTDSAGSCSATTRRVNTSTNLDGIDISVTSVTGGSLTYNAGANHDPDGDSDGTSIIVLPPAGAQFAR